MPSLSPSTLKAVLPQVDWIVRQLQARDDVPDEVKTTALAFADALKRWISNG